MKRKRTKHKFLLVTILPAERVPPRLISLRETLNSCQCHRRVRSGRPALALATSCCRQLISRASAEPPACPGKRLCPLKTTTTTQPDPAWCHPCGFIYRMQNMEKGSSRTPRMSFSPGFWFFFFHVPLSFELLFTFAPPTVACCNTVLFI